MPQRPHRLTLADHLATWDAPRLGRLLDRRPDLAGPTAPATVDEVAQRALTIRSIDRALEQLRRPELSVVELVVCLRPDAPLADLAAALPHDTALADVEPVLDRLDELALVWRSAERLHWSGALTDTIPSGLGPPVRDLVEVQPVDYLHHAVRGLRAAAPAELAEAVPATGAGDAGARKADLVDELEALLAVPGLVDAVLEVVSAEAGDLARALGRRGGYVQLSYDLTFARYGRAYDAGRPERELFDLGLLLPVRYDGVAFLPREAGVSLRGGRPVARLDLTPPPVEPTPVDQAAVDQAAGAAVAQLLHQLADLLARWEHEPAKVLKAGGLGVTVMKGVATALDVPIEEANRLVEVLALGGLLQHRNRLRGSGRSAATEVVVVPAPAAEAWLDRPAAVQWRQLANAWRHAEHWPSDSGRRDEPGAPAVLVRQHGWGAADRRRFVLDALADQPAAHAVRVDQLGARIADDHPWAWTQLANPAVTIGRTLDEAQLLGIAAVAAPDPGAPAAGLAASTFGRALLTGDDEAAQAALDACLPPQGTTFLLQADLTVTVVGALERPVLTELRLLADVESTGAATTLRLSEGSIRRALDAGRTAEELLGFLEEHAAKGVPNPVTFLVNDAARRHGHLQVGEARSFVTSADPAVLADACSHRRTRKLRLRLLAPTVAVSSVDAATVLDGLRDAGFAPVPDTSDPAGIDLGPTAPDAGRLAAPGPAGALPEPFRQRQAPPRAGPTPTGADLAATLLAAPRAAAVRRSSALSTPAAPVPTDRRGGGPGNMVEELARAIAGGAALAVDHVDEDGRVRSSLLVDVLLDDTVIAGVDLRSDAALEIELDAIVRAVALDLGTAAGTEGGAGEGPRRSRAWRP